MAVNSARVSTRIFWSIAACAMEPRMSCCHRRQSKEMDSEKAATSAAGPLANRPEREVMELFFIELRTGNVCGRAAKVTREAARWGRDAMACRRKREPCGSLGVGRGGFLNSQSARAVSQA